MDMNYLTFLYFGTIVLPTLFMAVVYGFIYRAVQCQVSEHRGSTVARKQGVGSVGWSGDRSVSTGAREQRPVQGAGRLVVGRGWAGQYPGWR